MEPRPRYGLRVGDIAAGPGKPAAARRRALPL